MIKQAYAILLAQLAEMPEFLERTAKSLSPGILSRTSSDDQFPLIEHLWHIRDCDPDLYALRIRKVLYENRPTLEPVDVGAWYSQRNYRCRSGDQAIEEFARLRLALIAELSHLEEQELSRVGVRADGSEINVLGIIEQLAAHDRDHRWRIAAILRSLSDSTASDQTP